MTELLIIALVLFGYAMVSERLSTSVVTAPMVFTTAGLIVGAGGLGWFDLELDGEATSILVEATLVLVLFTDAIRIDLRVLRREAALPGRLLGIGLPLTILTGTALALIVVPGLGVIEAALLAAVLAPTDAALGQAVVVDRRLPVRIRQTLNVESGLNDGIAVPVVTVLLVAASAAAAGGASDWIGLAAREVGFGVLAGVAAGVIGGRLLNRQADAGQVEGVYRQLAAIAIAVTAFALAGLLHGNGFIAAFVAGLSFGHFARGQCANVQDFTEDEGELMTSITFILFGAVLVGPVLRDLTWQIALYVALSLTVIRIVPIVVSLTGSGTRFETRLFLGWFGPRGLASILFALLVVEELESPAGQVIFTAAAWTVLVSVFVHGSTATLWAGRLARRLDASNSPTAESGPMTEFVTRSSRWSR